MREPTPTREKWKLNLNRAKIVNFLYHIFKQIISFLNGRVPNFNSRIYMKQIIKLKQLGR